MFKCSNIFKEYIRMIYLISGKMGTGKSTLASALGSRISANLFKFADPIYTMHDAVKELAESYGIEFGEKNRRFLELIGTEVFREADPDVWVNIMRERISTSNNVIIDDCRFPNELFAFEESIKIKLVCEDTVRFDRMGNYSTQSHKSNTALDHISDDVYDYVFDTGTMSTEEILEWITMSIPHKKKI